jgi:phosphoribosyl 1,2-cyclic phosphodiesterase
MKLIQHYSSSRANLYEVISNDGERLLIECGCTWKQLTKKLNFDLSNIMGCLLSHIHKDHSKCAKDVSKAGIKIPELEFMKIIDIGPFRILPFELVHDVDCLGFVIRCDNEYLLYAIDTAYIRQRFAYPFSIIALECSFDKSILQNHIDTKSINEIVTKRLLNSHQEKSVCLNYLQKFCDLSQCREIHLLHMSNSNIDKKETIKEFEEKLFVKVIAI